MPADMPSAEIPSADEPIGGDTDFSSTLAAAGSAGVQPSASILTASIVVARIVPADLGPDVVGPGTGSAGVTHWAGASAAVPPSRSGETEKIAVRRGSLKTRLSKTTSFRLTLTYVSIFGISVLALLVFIYLRTAQSISQQTDDTIAAEVDALAQYYRVGGLQGLVAEVDARGSRENITGSLYLLTDDHLQRITGNIHNWPIDLKTDADSDHRVVFSLVGRDGATVTGRGQISQLPAGYNLLVGRDTHELERFQVLMIRAIAWALGGMVLLGIGGGYLMTRRVMRRIDDLNQGAIRIMRGDMGHRMRVDGSGDEYDRVASTLNIMLDQIERLVTGIRSVTNAVAHDLRSPLTRIRTQMEGALLSAKSEMAFREACEQAIAEADGCLATFNALLSIAEADAGVGLVEAADIDVRQSLEDLAELYTPVAEEAGLQIKVEVSSEQTIRANRELLVQALTNLIDNALKYVPAPGIIRLTWSESETTLDLAVTDNGPGIAANDRSRVVERFVRLDASRTSPGNGLGLSLVAAIASKHRATFVLEDANPGLRAVLQFSKFPGEKRR